MFCIRCQNDVYYCTCPDIHERMAAIAEHKGYAVAWCTGCDRHKDLCICDDVGLPADVVLKSGGVFHQIVSWLKDKLL